MSAQSRCRALIHSLDGAPFTDRHPVDLHKHVYARFGGKLTASSALTERHEKPCDRDHACRVWRRGPLGCFQALCGPWTRLLILLDPTEAFGTDHPPGMW